MHDKIALLMEETGCDRGEAELALEMCGFEVEEAVKAIPRLLKNIVILKGKFIHSAENQFGLLLVILNTKSGILMRSRAVVSFNPAVCSVSLDKDWFEFEKYLYSCRLWDGSLQMESLEIEKILSNHFRDAPCVARTEKLSLEALSRELCDALKRIFYSKELNLRVKRDIVDLGSFQSLRNDPVNATRKARRESPRTLLKAEELLVLKITLEEAPDGIMACDLRAGDMVSAQIIDNRDIACYLAKLFGGYSGQGPVWVLAPLEAVEAVPPSGMLARVRFSVGVCGDALILRDKRLKVVRSAPGPQESVSWWRRFFNTR